ncbi:MAG: hypothetical protein JOS17DRAFT_765308 [Linnemannia elongata]|nr:MAG: hypothetical protein JOS17DRAFT_765308 [Linnemannia elongata]
MRQRQRVYYCSFISCFLLLTFHFFFSLCFTVESLPILHTFNKATLSTTKRPTKSALRISIIETIDGCMERASGFIEIPMEEGPRRRYDLSILESTSKRFNGNPKDTGLLN